MNSKKTTFSLSFFISKTKAKQNGECPVYMKINLDGQKTSFQIKRHIHPDLWDSGRSKMIGRTNQARVFNEYLEAILLKGHRAYNELLKQHDVISPQLLRDTILGKNSAKPIMIIELWTEFVEDMRKLIGKETSYTNVQKSDTARKHFQSFLKEVHKSKDISIKAIDNRMIEKFSLYLRTTKNLGHNTTIKVLQYFKRIIGEAIKNGWLTLDPFARISLRLEDVARPFLTEEELQRIIDFESNFDRMNRVRDFFLFACFTGLSYADVKKLTRGEIQKLDETYWIRTSRQKTGGIANIPLLDVPLAIIKRYSYLEDMEDDEKVLPILSNQKMNAYLKEIADLCKINKVLSFHVARHTFATTVTMTNGVPIESVSKMLGHKDLKSTQHYARIVDQKVGADMAILHQKLRNKMSLTG